MKSYRSQILFIVIAIILVLLTRTVLRVGYNIELVTAFAITAGFLFKDKHLALLVPILSLFVSDIVIGNSNIFIFTWSGFIIAPAIGIILNKINLKRLSTITNLSIKGVVGGSLSTIVFFFWTNFGVVLTSNMYTKDFAGLLQSYFMGLPFLRNQFLGNLILVPIVLIATYLVLDYLNHRKEASNLEIFPIK